MPAVMRGFDGKITQGTADTVLVFMTDWTAKMTQDYAEQGPFLNDAGTLYRARTSKKLEGTIKGVVPKYGISHDPGTDNPVTHNLFEFQEIWRDVKKAPGLKNKLMYIFGPPGWSHDGSSMTSKQLQAELAMAKAQGKEVPHHEFIRSN